MGDQNNNVIELECNGNNAVSFDDDYDSEEEEISFTQVDTDEKNTIALQNDYIKELLQHTRIEILQKETVKNPYSINKELGLFHLFLSRSFFESLHVWTNTCLEETGKRKISGSKSMAYVGMELA